MTVEITVTRGGVDGRKVTFDVSAQDELDAISAGTHTRFVVDVPAIERLRKRPPSVTR